jgi:hypothetical protein
LKYGDAGDALVFVVACILVLIALDLFIYYN